MRILYDFVALLLLHHHFCAFVRGVSQNDFYLAIQYVINNTSCEYERLYDIGRGKKGRKKQ